MKFLFLLILLIKFNSINNQVVCSLDELIEEIYDDLNDNGKLDCLRVENELNLEINENFQLDEKKRKALWTSDCSFEAELEGKESTWHQKLFENYNLKKGLVDVDGNPVQKDFDNQADMCEIIRAFVANGKFTELSEDIKYIPLILIDFISCPGNDFQTQICAVNGGSFSENHKWYILLDGQPMTINGEPYYEQNNLN
jgi:hypothetical protein